MLPVVGLYNMEFTDAITGKLSVRITESIYGNV